MSFKLKKIENKELFFQGTFGLEKENLRCDTNGFVAATKHPFKENKNIDRDFCESQVELITDVCKDTSQVWEEISRLHNYAQRHLLEQSGGRELLWPFSNPPYIRENDIFVASFSGKLKDKEIYRNYLAKKYGKKKMLFCGIHYNFAFSDDLIMDAFKEDEAKEFSEYKNNVYMELAKKVIKYSWLIVYLTAASPMFDESIYEENRFGNSILSGYTSARCSKIGYWNNFMPILNYNSPAEYVDSIQSYIDSGQLRSVGELYLPVRLKPKGENLLKNISNNGIDHIELRMLDLNPLSPVGIMKEDIDFIHYFLIYLMFEPEEAFGDLEQNIALKNMKMAAEYKDQVLIETSWGEMTEISEAALEILQSMKEFFASFDALGTTEKALDYQIEKAVDRKNSYAVRIARQFGDDYVKKGIVLAKEYAKERY